MTFTIKINQKHIERLAFSLIIIILLGNIVMDKYNLTPNPNQTITGFQVEELLPTNNIEKTIIPNMTTTTNKEITTTTKQTPTTTSTTTTTMMKELLISISDIKTEKIDDNKGKIKSFKLKLINGLNHDVYPTIKYYIYDQESSDSEITNPKKPEIKMGTVLAGKTETIIGDIDKYVFNLDLEKTIKIKIIDEDYGISKTIIQKITIK